MPSDANFLDINLFGKEYRIACPPEEKDALLRAVAYVDGQMHEIAKKTRSNATERVAVMAALNIAHDFLLLQNQPSEENPTPVHPSEGGLDFGAVKGRIALMEAQLNAVLEPQDKLI
ncbi:MAG: cell division protein ZapA [Candidatus Accumulibacter sp.]|jgi:cell division protein ZapA|nr:cell division protein ZapA [Accumulibacter sp.]